jgi:hypothetical protein
MAMGWTPVASFWLATMIAWLAVVAMIAWLAVVAMVVASAMVAVVAGLATMIAWLAVVTMVTRLGMVTMVVASAMVAVVVVTRARLAVVTVTASIMTFLGFLNALSPSCFHALASLGLLLFAHVVPAVSQGGRRSFPVGGPVGTSPGLAMRFRMRGTGLAVLTALLALALPTFLGRRTFAIFSRGEIGEKEEDG